MTGTSARNSYGIFKSKRAKCLAIKYGLHLYDKNAYIHSGNLILYSDVKFIVDNYWMDHFMYGTDKPIDVSYNQYCDIYYSLKDSFSGLFNLSYE
jgi:hypothetical protein